MRGDDKAILGEYADEGYYLKEYADRVVTVNYKDQELAAFAETAKTTTPEQLRDVCKRHQARLATPAGVSQ